MDNELLEMITVDLKSLVGQHTLYGYKSEDKENNDSYGPSTHQMVTIKLDDVTYTFIEDADDGYRSTLGRVIVSEMPCDELAKPIKVEVQYVINNTEDMLYFIDIEKGKQILQLGTDCYDSYYPGFINAWNPDGWEKENKE